MTRFRFLSGVLAAAAGGSLLLRDAILIEEIAARELDLRQSSDRAPRLTFIQGFVYTLTSLFPGTSGKPILCGWSAYAKVVWRRRLESCSDTR